MFKKQMGAKIMAVLLAVAVALPSAGTVMAAEPVPAKTESENASESGKSAWDNLFHNVYPKSDGTDKSSGSGSGSGSGSKTGIGETKVKLSVVAAEDIVYGDNLNDKITVTATDTSDSTEIKNFTEYELNYYDTDQKALTEPPKDAGTYYVEAVVKEDSDKYTGEASEQVSFTIAPKTLKLILEEQHIDVNKLDQVSETYSLKLAEDSTLAYNEEFEEGYPKVSCDIMKDEQVVAIDALQVGEYVLKVRLNSVQLGLAAEAKAENYKVESIEDAKLIVAEMLALEVAGDETFLYGEFDDTKFLKSAVTATNHQGEVEELAEDRLSFQYYGAEEKELTELPRNAGKYKVVAVYKYDETDHKEGRSEAFAFEITQRTIDIKLDSFEIENGAVLPTEEELKEKLSIEGLVKEEGEEKLPYNDEWEIAPKAYFEKEDIDTTVAGEYSILIEAKLAEACASNYVLNVPEFATMTIAESAGEEKGELILKLEDVSVAYGDSVEEAVKAAITAIDKKDESTVELAADKFTLKYFDTAGTELLETPIHVLEGGYQVKAVFDGDGAYKKAESENVKLNITKREIIIKAKNYGIANGKPAPDKLELEEEIKLSYEDQWAEGGEPKAAFEDAEIDTKVAGEYTIVVSAAVEESKKDNYELTLENGKLRIAELNPETNKSKDILHLVEGTVTTKTYDGNPFENPILREAVTSEFGYTGPLEFIWSTSDEKAPKDAGNYKMTIRIPDSDLDWEGSLEVELTIEKAVVTATAKPAATETCAGEPVRCDIETIGFYNDDNWVRKPTVKVVEGNINKAGSYKVQAKGGDAGHNYTITYGDTVTITVLAETKRIITDEMVTLGKKSDPSPYTGEQIRPAVTVTYTYLNEKGRTAKQKLKLNVDYVVSYANNVNAAKKDAEDAPEIIVTGIGEYAGVIIKKFTINPKSISKVTLSAVSDIKFESDGTTSRLPKPTVMVMDGNYELSENDYEIEVKEKGSANFTSLDQLKDPVNTVLEKVELRVKAKENSNYDGESKKKVKFNILGSGLDVKSIADVAKIEFTAPNKVYTYNSKAQKPKVKVTYKEGNDNAGKKLKSSEYKVIYSNNVNAGVATAEVRIVGVYKWNAKKGTGTGYYGTTDPIIFTIKQKSFSKISKPTAGTVIPPNVNLENIVIVAKDGKRILTEGVDYEIDYSSICSDLTTGILDGGQKDGTIKIGQKYTLTLKALAGGNYIPYSEDSNSKKDAVVKFGQLNLASKTANITVKLVGGSANENVKVTYNNLELRQGIDYEVSGKIKQDKKTGKYTVKIKAVKKKGQQCFYKGTRTVKNLDITPVENQ